jgi:hypothetical protein
MMTLSGTWCRSISRLLQRRCKQIEPRRQRGGCIPAPDIERTLPDSRTFELSISSHPAADSSRGGGCVKSVSPRFRLATRPASSSGRSTATSLTIQSWPTCRATPASSRDPRWTPQACTSRWSGSGCFESTPGRRDDRMGSIEHIASSGEPAHPIHHAIFPTR